MVTLVRSVTAGVAPNPEAWANNDVKPAIEELQANGGVYFQGSRVGSPGTLSSNAFVSFPINQTDVNIGGGSYNTGTYIYTIPSDGIYDCQALVRAADNTNARSLGVGIGTENADGGHFEWGSFGGTGSFMRNGRPYRRLTRFNTGDQVRLYIYSAGETFDSTAGYMAIMKVMS